MSDAGVLTDREERSVKRKKKGEQNSGGRSFHEMFGREGGRVFNWPQRG